MANTKENVAVGKPNVSGAVFWAPLGTTLPTDATSPLDVAFKPWGYISEDGLTEAIERSSESKKAWGGAVVKSVSSEHSETYTFTAIETNAEVLKGRYGDNNVIGTLPTGLQIKHTGDNLENHVFVFETLLDNGIIDRKILGDAQVIETGEVVYQDSEVIAYPVTVQAYEHDGLYVNEYMAKAE